MYSFSMLYEQLAETELEYFYRVESSFVLMLYDMDKDTMPDCVMAFLCISNWLSSSLRSGVWTYYEIADPSDLRRTLNYLQSTNERELESIFSYGIHNYHNPVYLESYNYPEFWISESEDIDRWIYDNESFIWKWERDLLLKHKNLICSLV